MELGRLQSLTPMMASTTGGGRRAQGNGPQRRKPMRGPAKPGPQPSRSVARQRHKGRRLPRPRPVASVPPGVARGQPRAKARRQRPSTHSARSHGVEPANGGKSQIGWLIRAFNPCGVDPDFPWPLLLDAWGGPGDLFYASSAGLAAGPTASRCDSGCRGLRGLWEKGNREPGTVTRCHYACECATISFRV